jgi:hypothetical protein
VITYGAEVGLAGLRAHEQSDWPDYDSTVEQ